jgi:hypothetical protein
MSRKQHRLELGGLNLVNRSNCGELASRRSSQSRSWLWCPHQTDAAVSDFDAGREAITGGT